MRLDGSQVYLRPLAVGDTDLIVRWRSNAAVSNQLFSERPPTRKEHEAWFVNVQRVSDQREWVIVVRDGKQPVGTIGLRRINWVRGEAEYGILIGEDPWRGKGIGREASQLVLQCAFERLKLRVLVARLFADNIPAQTLYRRLGFVPESTGAGERMKHGVVRPTMLMRCTPDTWVRAISSGDLQVSRKSTRRVLR